MRERMNTSNKYMSLAAITLAFSFTFLSRYIWSPLMADVSGEFGINATQAGLYMSAFFAGYLVTQIPGGIMADRYQPKYILIACTVLGGVMTALMSKITSYEMGLVIRVITGVSSGCVMAQCSKVVALTFAPQERASAMGVVLASPPFGITLAQSLGAPLNQAFGWRTTFLIVEFVAAGIVVLLALFVKPAEKKATAGETVGEAGKAVVQTAAAKTPAQAGILEGLVGFFSNKQQLLLGVSGFMFMFVSVGFATWTNQYAQNLGFSPVQGGMIITCYSIAGIIASCLSGSIAKKNAYESSEFPHAYLNRHGSNDDSFFHAENVYGIDSCGHCLWCSFLSAVNPLHDICNDAGRRVFYCNGCVHPEPAVPAGQSDYADCSRPCN